MGSVSKVDLQLLFFPTNQAVPRAFRPGLFPGTTCCNIQPLKYGSFYLFANVRAIPGLLLGASMRCSWEITSYLLVLSFPFFS